MAYASDSSVPVFGGARTDSHLRTVVGSSAAGYVPSSVTTPVMSGTGSVTAAPLFWDGSGEYDPHGVVRVASNTGGSFSRLQITGGEGLYRLCGSIFASQSILTGLSVPGSGGGSLSSFALDLYENDTAVRRVASAVGGSAFTQLSFEEHRTVSTASTYWDLRLTYVHGAAAAAATVSVGAPSVLGGGHVVVQRVSTRIGAL